MFKREWQEFYYEVEPMFRKATKLYNKMQREKKLEYTRQSGGMREGMGEDEVTNYLHVVFFIAILFWGLRQRHLPIIEFLEIMYQ
jgi:hypothetical protein